MTCWSLSWIWKETVWPQINSKNLWDPSKAWNNTQWQAGCQVKASVLGTPWSPQK